MVKQGKQLKKAKKSEVTTRSEVTVLWYFLLFHISFYIYLYIYISRYGHYFSSLQLFGTLFQHYLKNNNFATNVPFIKDSPYPLMTKVFC